MASELHEIKAAPSQLQPVSTRRKILTGRLSGHKRKSNLRETWCTIEKIGIIP